MIVDPKEDRKNSKEVLGKIEKSIDLQMNIRTLDYLFTNCYPEFPARTIKEWFEGNHILVNEIQDIIDVIRRHPLMPPSVKVTVLSNRNAQKNLILHSFKDYVNGMMNITIYPSLL